MGQLVEAADALISLRLADFERLAFLRVLRSTLRNDPEFGDVIITDETVPE